MTDTEVDLQRLELIRLEILSAVVDANSFHRAAEDLRMPPSTVQKYMRAFEEDWGIRLFDRVGREIRVRDEAKQLSEAMQPVLIRARELVTRIQRTGITDITIRLTCAAAHLAYYVGHLIHRFKEDHPEVNVELTVLSPVTETEQFKDRSVMKRQLHGGLADFVVCNSSVVDESQVVLWRTNLVCVMADGHPLRARRHVTVSDLQGERVIALPDYWWSRRMLDGLIYESGAEMPVITEPLAEVAVGAARAGLAVVVIADDGLAGLDENYPMVVENGRRISTEVSIHWMAHKLTEPMKTLLDYIARNETN